MSRMAVFACIVASIFCFGDALTRYQASAQTIDDLLISREPLAQYRAPVASVQSTTSPNKTVDDLLFSQEPLAQYRAPLAPVQNTPPRYYVGGSLSWVHHTGYVPNKLKPHEADNAGDYTFGGKVFAGYRYSKKLQFEVAYHYMGEVPFDEGFRYINGVLTNALFVSYESSYAFSGSAIYNFPDVSEWLGPTIVPMHVFLRGGFAYKHIRHETVFGVAQEGTLSGVIGAGLEARLSPRWFARTEIEHLSTAIGGPLQKTPLLKGAGVITIGGTHQAINIMNTQLMMTIGYNL
jgi:hypothetical protein